MHKTTTTVKRHTDVKYEQEMESFIESGVYILRVDYSNRIENFKLIKQ